MFSINRKIKQQQTNHDSFRVATKWVLQEASEREISVGHVSGFAISQGEDNIPESWKGEINFAWFSQALALGSRFWLSLRA